MRNPFLLGLFDSLAHTDHRTAPVDVRTVLREHGIGRRPRSVAGCRGV